MKNLILISILSLLTAVGSTARTEAYPDEYLGLPGDNLNLYATMKLFQESETLEDFERSLNDENSRINNLDLNGDNLVDYIMVMDYADGDVHTIVLRAALNRDETQDVAVFTVQRFNDGSVQIQCVGDEALYGRNYIVEPIYADNNETSNPGYIGNTGNNGRPSVVSVTTYQVAAWPVIRYIYRPTYVSWHSSWYWGYYPSYWNPWRPFYWHTYYGYHSNFHNHYYAHYRHWDHHRYHRYNDHYYSSIRTYSPRVTVRIKEGNYRNTYSRPDLRRKGEALYTRTSRENSSSRTSYSGRRSDTNNSSTLKSRSTRSVNTGSERRAVSPTTTRKSTNQSINPGTRTSRKSTTIQPKRSVTSPSSESKTNVSRKARTTGNATYRAGSNSSVTKQKAVSPRPTTIRDSRTTKPSSVRQSPSSPKRSSPAVSTKSVSKPKASPRSVSTRSSSRPRKAAVSSSGSSSRSSKASSRTSSSRSSSNGSPSRR